jgi:transcriptional regulator with GAF, ATPase, and Fis domain
MPDLPPTPQERKLAYLSTPSAEGLGIDPISVLEHILDAAIENTNADRGYILALESGKWNIKAARWFSPKRGISFQHIQTSETLAFKAFKEDRTVVIDNPFLYVGTKSAKGIGFEYLMAAPLRKSGALLVIDSQKPKSQFGPPGAALLDPLLPIADYVLSTMKEHETLRRRLDAILTTKDRPYPGLVGSSPAMKEVCDKIEWTADSDEPVLVLGESGTGKGALVQTIYERAKALGRCSGRLVSQNVTALSESIAEAELFGHRKGAFTGADDDRRGLFRTAENGIFFLDEIGDLSLRLQPKILSVLQDRRIRPVGDENGEKIVVRFFAATHRDLRGLVRQGKFREDLYYRLRVIQIRVPALRERRQDIPELVDHFLDVIAAETGRPKPRVEASAFRLMRTYKWPGNVRELENCLRAVCAWLADPIRATHLETALELPPKPTLGPDIDEVVENALRNAALACDGKAKEMARMLGTSRSYIYKKAEQFGITLRRRRPRP